MNQRCLLILLITALTIRINAQAKAIIKDIMLYDGNGLQILLRKTETKSWQYRYKASYNIYSSERSKAPYNSQCANNAIKYAGFKDTQTAHGFKALASTALNEKQFNPELIEFTLSHADKNSVRSTYNHSRYIEPRK